MKKHFIVVMMLLPLWSAAQIGLKAGINFANVTQSSSLNNSNRSGFNLGIILATPGNRLFGSQTEFLYSRQGYNFKTNTNTGVVDLDYLMLPQYMSINITRLVSVLFGCHIAYLINAKVDSTGSSLPGNPASGILKYYEKFDFGFGGGVEVHLVLGLLLGARINLSFGNLFSDLNNPSNGTPPSFVPKVNVKNNLFSIYTGWRFGRKH